MSGPGGYQSVDRRFEREAHVPVHATAEPNETPRPLVIRAALIAGVGVGAGLVWWWLRL